MKQATAKASLGKKTVALFLVLGVSFSVGIFLALQWSVVPTFEDFERESSENAVARATGALQDNLRAIEIFGKEYAFWDQTYDFAQGRRSEYAEENLDPEYFHSIEINMFLLFDARGDLLNGYIGDPTDGSPLSLDEEFLQPLTRDHALVTHEAASHSKKGLLQTRAGLMQVVSFPILTSAQEGPIAGSLVAGQFLADARVAELGKRSTADVALYSAATKNASPQAAAVVQSLLSSGEAQHLETTESSTLQFRTLYDVFGEPAAVLEVVTPRRITRIGSGTVRTAMTFLGVTSAIFLVAAWLFMQRLIVAPVASLTEQMLGIQSTSDLKISVGSGRSDELGVLAGEFSKLTSRLKKAQDESETARLESERARDQALAMSKTKSEFLARMSHEIRTPMNGVLGMTELLQGTQLDARQQRFTRTIYESAESLLSIINDILDFSKMEAGKLRLEMLEVDLHSLLEEAADGVANLAYAKGLELVNVPPMGLTTSVEVDPGRLRQVLTNLLGNAIKFTEEGEVALRVTSTDIDAENAKVFFEIADTGIGIRPEKQKDIFESFTQEDGTTTRVYGGTGLGLAISKQLVDLMGGDLEVESAPGKGATFSFSLDMKKGGEICHRIATQPKFVAGTRILIVDDNSTNREILEHQLTGWRAHIDSADSAGSALTILESASAAGDPHDLAILDMHMPHTDGLQLARAIRDNPDLADLKLIILSSVAAAVSEESVLELDIVGQLTKPVRQSQLYDSLVVVLGGDTVAQTHSRLNVESVRSLSGRVLLAEDNTVNQAVAIGMLESMGLFVAVAVDGKEAVQKASNDSFDVILMDCQMPNMDGFQAAKAIRAAENETGKSPTPIIAVTANALKGDRDQCLAAGMDDYLTKPFTSEQLHSILTSHFQPDTNARQDDQEAHAEKHDPTDALSRCDSPIDSDVLENLSRLQQPGAPSIVERVVILYLESSGEVASKLRDAVASANAGLLRESAHALKSSSINVGAVRLADLCQRLEVMAREGDLSQVPTTHKRFEAEYQRVVAALKLEAELTAA